MNNQHASLPVRANRNKNTAGLTIRRITGAFAIPLTTALLALAVMLLLGHTAQAANNAETTQNGAVNTLAEPSPVEKSQATIFYVTDTGSGTNCSQAQPCLLRTAAEQASDGDEIRVAAGLYDDIYVTSDHTQTLVLDASVWLRGGYDAADWSADPDPTSNITIIDGANQGRGIYIQGDIAPIIEGFTIRNGRVTGPGAGIYNISGTPTIRHNIIHNNDAQGNGGNGAGIYDGGFATITHNELYLNSSGGQGAGIVVQNNGSATSLIAYNQIHDNTSSIFGGGISLAEGKALVDANAIYSNTGTFGGGIFILSNFNLVIQNNMIYRNQATTPGTNGAGGGLAIQPSSGLPVIYIWNNTIVANQATTAGNKGGGIAIFGGSAEIRNTIVASNTASSPSGIFRFNVSIPVTASHNNVFGNDTNITLNNPINGAPQFVNFNASNFHLTATSPNINSGDLTVPVTEDYDGQGRPFDGGIEVGADEYYDPTNQCFARLNSGGVYDNIQEVVNLSTSPTDTVKVAGRCTGSGSQVVLLNTTLTLQGGYTTTDWANPTYGPAVIDAQNASGRRGILVSGGSPTIDSIRVTGGNLPAGNGSGIYIQSNGTTVRNTVLHGNSAPADGGALGVAVAVNADLSFNTIANNNADGVNFETTGSIHNSIIYNNSGDEISGGSGHTFNLVDVNPLFVNAAGGDFRIMAASPAVDFANPAATLDHDFDGAPRPAGNAFDAGADEANEYPAMRFEPSILERDVERGTVYTFTHLLTNTGTLPDTYNLIHTNTDNWDVDYPSAISLDPGEQATVLVAVDVPLSAQATDLATTYVTATSSVNNNVQASVTDIVNVQPIPGLSFTPSYSSSLLPGTTITYTHWLTNTGDFTDTVTVAIANDLFDWAELVPAGTITQVVLASGDSKTLQVRVQVAPKAAAGLLNPVVLRATSTLSPAITVEVTDTVIAKATVGTRYVRPNGTDTNNNCTQPNDPCLTIARAIGQASLEDEVRIAEGTYHESDMNVNSTVFVSGGWLLNFSQQAGGPTIIDGDGANRILNIAPGSGVQPTFDNLTLRGGSTSAVGGAIWVQQDARPRFTRLTIAQSNSSLGGAVYLSEGSSAVISQTTFISNTASRNGGAIYQKGGTLLLVQSRFMGNNATGTLAGQGGGAIYLEAGTLQGYNNLFYQNTAFQDGGAINTDAGSANLLHNTWSNNAAANRGGVLYNSGAIVTLRSSILSNNDAANGDAVFQSSGTTTMDYNDYWNNTSNVAEGSNSLHVDPLFADAGFRLSSLSLAVDTADPNSPINVDFEGDPRPVDQGFDMGWDELAGCLAERNDIIYGGIQEAIDAGGPEMLIRVSGHCRGVHTITVDGETISQTVHLFEGLTIQGGWNATFDNNLAVSLVPTFVDPLERGRGFYLEGSSVITIENITVINGNATGLGGGPAGEDAGGGVYVAGGNADFRNLGLRDSVATLGGGFYNDDGTVTLLPFESTAVLTTVITHTNGITEVITSINNLVQTNDFAFNTATNGAALYNHIGALNIESGYIHDNQASSNGGGFFNNTGLMSAANVIFANNQAAANGGAIYNQSSNSALLHLTIYSNTAALGGGIYSAGGAPQIRSSIFQGNQASNGRSIYIAAGSANIDYNYYHPQAADHVFGGILGTHSLHSSTPPGLIDPPAGDFHLSDGGPAADRADPASPILVDYELQERPTNQGWDMGADEAGSCRARVRSSGLIYGGIQLAISNALEGDWVDVAGICSGVHQYTSASMGVISQTVHLDVNVNLQGGWDLNFTSINTATVLNAAEWGRVLYVAPGITATVRGFTMTGGNATADGLNGQGGAIYLDNALAFVEDNEIAGNTAINGGAIYVNGGSPTIWYGNVIHDNAASAAGGAFYVAGGTPLIANNFIFLNSAANGGGFANANGSPNFWHNTLVNNNVTGNGGGIYVSGGAPSINSTIVMSNSAAVGGGGAYGAGGTASLGYNDFYNNLPTNFGGTIVNGGPGSLSVDPEFTDLDRYNLTITTTSPVMDRGAPTMPLLVDYEGDIRPSNQGWDMGADEIGGCYAMVVSSGEIYGSIQLAADMALDGDTVLVDGYCRNVNGREVSSVTVSQTLFIDKNLTVDGNWDSGFLPAGTPATLDPLARGRAVYVASGVSVTLTHMTLVNGDATVTGLSNGGGIYNTGSLTLTNMFIHNHTAVNGGGIYNATSSQAHLSHSTIATNTAETAGGGIYNQSGALTLESNRIVGNDAENGAGVYLNSGSGTAVAIQNNFIYLNDATGNGGGLYNANTNAAIWHNTFVNNDAFGSNGGGIFSANGQPTIHNNIVDSGNGTGIHAAAGSPDIDYNNVFNYSGGGYGGIATPGPGAISEEPIYLPGLHNYHLDEDSPGVDVGDPASPIDHDYDGHIRPTNGGWDMGADEVNSCLIRVVDPNGPGTRIFGVLQDAIDYAEDNDFTLVQIARGECRGVKEDPESGTFQVGYVRENLEFVGSLRRLDFADPLDYYSLEVGTVSSVINAEGQGRVIYIAPGATPTFLHLAFVNGNAFAAGDTNNNGGAIYNAGDSSFDETFLSQSSAQNGGGYYGTIGTSADLVSQASLKEMEPLTTLDRRNLETTDIHGTGGRVGASIAARVDEAPNGLIQGVTYIFYEGNNATNNGGGIFNDGDLYITGLAIEGNTAGNQGGGIFNQGTFFEAINNGFFYNEADDDGGGFFNTDRPVRLINAVFLANRSLAEGGGIYNQGDLEVYHNTIFYNESVGDGAGIYHEGSSLTLNSSIVYTNTSLAGTVGGLRALAGNLDYNNFFENVPADATIPLGVHSISARPLFSGLWSLDRHSPDVDHADPTLVGPPLFIDFDAGNVIRPDGGTVHNGVRISDIGADEWWKDFGCIVQFPGIITAYPGETISYNMSVVNSGYPPPLYPHGFTDTITITLESTSQNWSTLEGEGEFLLDWTESTLVTVTVSIPPGTPSGTQETTIVKCQSASIPERVGFGQTTVNVETHRTVIIAPDYVDFAYPNDVITYTHTITNLGNLTDTYQVTANSGPAYASSAIVNPDGTLPLSDTVTLGPGKSTQVLLRVHILPDARSGAVATPGVVVRSTADATVFDAALNSITIGYIQGTRYVATAGGTDPTNNCTLPENPCATIQHAVNQALDGDDVLVALGVYTDVITSTVGNHTLFVNKSITITGGYDAADGFTTVQPITNAVVLDGQGIHRVVYVENGVTATLSALFIENGLAVPAPVNPPSGTLEAQAMVFVPTGGGGLYNAGANLTLDGVWLQSNQGQFGGAVYQEAGSLHLHSSVLAGNTVTGTGGGLYVAGGTALVENDTMAANSAAGEGGAIYQAAGSLLITNTIFYDNNASANSAIFAQPDAVADYNLFHLNSEPASNVPTGTHSFNADPLFSDTFYHIPADSPAEDAGTNAVSGGLDMDREARVQGTAVDIGADERLQLPGFDFEPTFQTALIDEGTVYTYTHTITNTGDFTDTYVLTASHQTTGGAGWDYDFYPTTITDLPVGGTATVTFVITGGPPGYQDYTIITATSQSAIPLSRSVTDHTRITQIAGVDIDPPQSLAGLPGATLVYTHTLLNTGNGPDTYTLTVSGNPADWPLTITPTNTGVVLPGDSLFFSVTVTIPPTTTVNTFHTAAVLATSNADPTVTDGLNNISTPLPIYGLLFTPNHTQTASPGDSIIYTHTVTSQANDTDTIDFTYSSEPDWQVTLSTESLILPPFSSATLQVTVTVPLTASGGVTHTAVITAASTISDTLEVSVVDTTIVPTEAGVLIEPDNFQVVDAGTAVTYNHTVTNTGNTDDTFNLSISGNNWSSQVTPLSVSLAPGQSAAVTVTVNVPGDALPGAEDVATVTAVSTMDPSVQDQAEDVTRVAQEHGLLFTPNLTQTVPPDTLVTYTHILTNTGNGEDEFGFTAVSAHGWITTTPSNVTLAAGASTSIQVTVQVPQGTAGEIDVMTVTAFSVISPTAATASVIDTTIVEESGNTPDIVIAPDNALNALAGQMVVYNHTMTNTGTLADTFNVSALSSQEWPVDVTPPNAFLLPGQSAPVVVTVTVPLTATPGTTDVTTVTAAAASDPAINDQATDTTTVDDTAFALVRIEPEQVSAAYPGDTLIYTHTVTNLGNQQDTINLATSTAPFWPVSLSADSFTLLAGQSATVQLTVIIPATAAPGTINVTTITATSSNEPSATDTATDTTIVLAPPGLVVYLPVIRGDAGVQPPPPPGTATPTPTATATTPPGSTATPTPTSTPTNPATATPTVGSCVLNPPAPANPAGIDLIVTNITITPNQPVAGQQAIIAVTIKNQGQTAVPVGNNFYLDFYDNPNPEPPLPFQWGNVAWGAQGAHMAPGASHTYTAVYTFGPGNHRLYAQVDTDNTVGEANEGNNIYGCLSLNVTGAQAEDDTLRPTSMPTADAPRHTPTPEAAIVPALPPPAEVERTPVPTP